MLHRSLLRTRLIVLASMACLFASSAVADGPLGLPTAAPKDVGLSPERLQRIDDTFQAYVDRKEAAGAMALIARRGKVGYVQTWGDRDREAGKEMTADTIFRIYSMSKPITSVAVMLLYEEGHFFLDDPVARFLPELAKMEVESETNGGNGALTIERKKATRQITIRDLLRHTAGLSYGIFGNTQVDQQYRAAGILADDKTIADTVEKLGGIPLRFEPGTHWHYSVSVDVAGRLVEVVSGQSFDEFLNERIFKPLGMVDTGFVVPAEKHDRFSVLYTPKGTQVDREAFLRGGPGSKLIEPLESNDLGDFKPGETYFSGGGGLVSTASDYLRFCQMMLNGGQLDGERLLSRKSVELMTSDHLEGITGFGRDGSTFGLGFAVTTDVGKSGSLGSVGSFAWGGAAGTRFWIDPEEELIGIFMVQILPHRTRMGEEFRLLTYQSIND